MPSSQSRQARTTSRSRAVRSRIAARAGRRPPVTSPIETPASVAKRIDERPLTTAIQVDGSVEVERVVDPQQVRREHAEHREAAREVDARDALRTVQAVPAGREVRASSRSLAQRPDVARSTTGGSRSVLPEQPHQERLLGVEAVLRLVPDDALRTVDHLGLDLVAAVGGQAVDEDRRPASRATSAPASPCRRRGRAGARASPPPCPSTPTCR